MNRAVVLPFTDRHVSKAALQTRYSGTTSASAVRIQLSKILQSGGFIHAPRMRRFLDYIVQETLAGRANQLCEYSIATSVFERDESFEPGLDPIVRNDARRLRQKLLEYYQRGRCGDSDQLLIEIPKGGYVPVFRFIGNAQTAKPRRQYRFVATLIREADGAEVWATEQPLQISENSEELCFALQLEVRSPVPPLTVIPTSRSSDRAHRSNRSREREAR
jgi:hypothetical protein